MTQPTHIRQLHEEADQHGRAAAALLEKYPDGGPPMPQSDFEEATRLHNLSKEARDKAKAEEARMEEQRKLAQEILQNQELADRNVRDQQIQAGMATAPPFMDRGIPDGGGKLSYEQIVSNVRSHTGMESARRTAHYVNWVRSGLYSGVARSHLSYAYPVLKDDPMIENIRIAAAGGDTVARAFIEAEERKIPFIDGEEQRLQVSGDQTLGGNTVPDEMMRQVEVAQKNYNAVQAAGATVITTSSGANMPIPTMNDTGNTVNVTAELTAPADTNFSFGRIILSAYRYPTGMVPVSYEMIRDTVITDLSSFIARALGARIGDGLGRDTTTGDGSGKPRGIVTAASDGTTGARATKPSYDRVVDLIVSVNSVYAANASFMFHRETLGEIMKLKDSQDRPLWFPSIAPEVPNTILGYRYYENPYMEKFSTTMNTYPILFGDMSKYYIRQVGGLMIQRADELYMKQGGIGFQATAYYDGNLIDAGTNPVKRYKNGT